ncbi:MAG: ATP-binding cassette domain-containing protein [Treponema sp.]|jgi:energy-coupling factor transport system ATP-binding protein|nr:ATP-binding cassette domain-containing protein [Treponema sp.]
MISVRDLSFSYENETTLENVSFDIREGEYVVLMGENGCGKSTLASCINGLLTPQYGGVLVNGLDVTTAVLADDAGKGKTTGSLRRIRALVGAVTQNPDSQIIGSTVEEDAAFGPENLGLTEAEIKARVDRALAAVGLEGARNRSPQTLSGGEKQRLAIAGVLAVESPCLLLDEPASMLDPEAADGLLFLMDELNVAGKTIIHITHELKHATRARRCLVLHKGRLVFDGIPGDLLQNPRLSDWGLKADFARPPQTLVSIGQPPIIQFDSASFSYLKTKKYKSRPRFQDDGSYSSHGSRVDSVGLNNVTVSIPRNSTIAVLGKNGCGKTTFLKHINGLLTPDTGTVSVAGGAKPFKRAALAIQSPESALFEAYIADDVAFAPKNAGLKGKPLVQRVKTAMDLGGLPFAEFADKETRALSGGEKRRAALAGALAMDGEILLLDEPFAGLDAKNRARVMNMIFEQKAKGKTVVAVTHSWDSAEAFDLALVMDKGRITAFGTPSEVSYLERNRSVESCPQPNRGDSKQDITANPLSPLQKLGAGKKLLWLLGLCGATLAGNVFFSVGALTLILLAGAFWGRVSVGSLLKRAFSSLPWMGIVVFFQLIFNWADDESRVIVEFFPISITTAEVYRSVSIITRVFTIVACLTLYLAATPLRETLGAVNRFLTRVRFPHGRDVALALGISLQCAPILTEEAARIRTAQLSRGGKKGFRGAFAVIIPLLLRALEKSETLASALLLRLYPPQSGIAR